MTLTKPHPVYLKAAKGEWICHADIAKLIRTALKKAYPDTKFSVTTKTYSGGGSVSVRWKDGPTYKEVDEIAGSFETKGFDGMIDLAHHRSLWLYPDGSAHMAHDTGTEGSSGYCPEYIESAKSGDAVLLENVSSAYVLCSRILSARTLELAIAETKAKNWTALEDFDWSQVTVIDSEYGAHMKGASSVRFYNEWLDSHIIRVASEMSYPELMN